MSWSNRIKKQAKMAGSRHFGLRDENKIRVLSLTLPIFRLMPLIFLKNMAQYVQYKTQ